MFEHRSDESEDVRNWIKIAHEKCILALTGKNV